MKKRNFLRLWLVLLSLMAEQGAQAYDFQVNGIYYNKMSDTAVSVAGASNPQGSITIPNTVTYLSKVYPVRTIALEAFSKCTEITGVTIGKNVIRIGDLAFAYCSGITSSIILPEGCQKIGASAFAYCGMDSIYIPNSVTSISMGAFEWCNNLKSITVPSEKVGWGAFHGCDNLETAYLDKAVTTISYGNGTNGTNDWFAFCKCPQLKTINVNNENSYYSSLNGVLYNKKGNKLILHPNMNDNNSDVLNNVDTIAASAYNYNDRLIDIIIPSNIKSIGSSAFSTCYNLQTVKCENATPLALTKKIFSDSTLNYGTLYVPQGSKIIYQNDSIWGAFKNIVEFDKFDNIASGTCGDNLTWTLDVSGALTISGTGAMTNYSSTSATPWNNYKTTIKSVLIENGVTTIGDKAFSETDMDSISIPTSVTIIGYEAFAWCKNLKSIKIPCQKLGLMSLYSCANLETVYLGKDVLTLTYYYNNSKLVSGKDALTLALCPKLKNIYVDSENTCFLSKNGVLYNKIGNKLIFHPNLNEENNAVLTNVDTIGFGAFNNNNRLQSIIIPSSIINIDDAAFSSCYNLQTVTCENATPIKLNDDIFSDSTLNTATLYVPVGSKSAYQSANYWCSFKNIEEYSNILATSISLDKESITVGAGKTVQLNATILPSEAIQTASWSSSDTNVATVNSDGLVTGVGAGTAYIIATTQDGSDLTTTATVTVKAIASSISLNKSAASLTVDETTQLTATILPVNVDNKKVQWTTNDSTVATVDTTGLVTAVGAGTAIITASTTDGSNLSTSATITVARKIVTATSIKLDKTAIELMEDETEQLTATVLPEETDNKNVKWSTTDRSVATVDSTGLVTAVGAGTAAILATTTDGSDLSAFATVTVTRKPVSVSEITLDKTAMTLEAGETGQLTATILPEDADNKSVSWSTSDNTVATVDTTGMVTALKEGSATITATAADGSGTTASCAVTVTAKFDPTTQPNYFTIGDCKARPGETFTLSVAMTNKNEIGGFQFDMQLPEGISMATNAKGKYIVTLNSDRIDGHVVTTNVVDGKIRIMAYSASASAFYENSGDILTVSLVADSTIEDGDYTINYSKVLLSGPDGTGYNDVDFTSTVTINSVIMGDANGDGEVNVSDVLLVANKAIGKDPAVFIFAAADVNKDGEINVSDVLLVANIAIGKLVVNAPMMGTYAGDELLVNDFSLNKGEEKTISIDLSNGLNFSAFQMNMRLPAGVELKEARLTSRATGTHALLTNANNFGETTLLAFSPATDNFVRNEGAILTLTLKADGNFSGNDMIDFNHILLADEMGNAREVEGKMVKISSTTGIDGVYSEENVYVIDHTIVIETPNAGKATISAVNGVSQTINVAAGRTEYPVANGGVYIVVVNGKAFKVRI